MRDSMIIAAACVAVALGACSGGGTTSGNQGAGEPGAGEPGNGDGGNGGNGDGSGAGDFSSLEAAKGFWEGLRGRIEGIAERSRTGTAAEKALVAGQADEAEEDYGDLVAGLTALRGTYEEGTAGYRDVDEYLTGVRTIWADVDSGRLSAARGAVADRWAVGLAGPSRDAAFNPAPREDFAVRFPRAQADGTAIPAAAAGDANVPGTNRLRIQTGAVTHADGKYVFSDRGTGTTDELNARSITLRTGAENPARWAIQGDDGTPDRIGNTDGELHYSVQVTPEGLVYKVGGNAIYYDFQRTFDVGGSVDGWSTSSLGPDRDPSTPYSVWGDGADGPNWIHDDVQLNFGEPSDPPSGWTAFYWNERIPFPDGWSIDSPEIVAKVADHDVARHDSDLGTYELWISNFGGVDRQSRIAGGAVRLDENERFLEYAAYGLFAYIDLLVSTRGPARQQAFHFGYDTFEDATDMKTTDLEGDTFNATFRGATMAYQFLNSRTKSPLRNEIRGDITLHARIGPDDDRSTGIGGNTISGEITNIERRTLDGSWSKFPQLQENTYTQSERIVLVGEDFQALSGGGYVDNYRPYGAEIGDGGEYEGYVYVQRWNNVRAIWEEMSWNWNTGTDSNSKFSGTIYGPRADDFENIETAGWWTVEPDIRGTDQTSSSYASDREGWGYVVGAYGADRTED